MLDILLLWTNISEMDSSSPIFFTSPLCVCVWGGPCSCHGQQKYDLQRSENQSNFRGLMPGGLLAADLINTIQFGGKFPGIINHQCT